MLDAIKRIRKIVDRHHPAGHLPYKIEDIRAAVLEVTGIDCVRFYGYPDDANNPVKGRFRRYDGQVAPYAGNGCIVEIDYNQSLDFDWTRFVICKELIHALEIDPSVRISPPS